MPRPPPTANPKPPPPQSSYRFSFPVGGLDGANLRDYFKTKLNTKCTFLEEKGVYHVHVPSNKQGKITVRCLADRGIKYFRYCTSDEDAKELNQYHKYDPILFRSFIDYMNQ